MDVFHLHILVLPSSRWRKKKKSFKLFHFWITGLRESMTCHGREVEILLGRKTNDLSAQSYCEILEGETNLAMVKATWMHWLSHALQPVSPAWTTSPCFLVVFSHCVIFKLTGEYREHLVLMVECYCCGGGCAFTHVFEDFLLPPIRFA